MKTLIENLTLQLETEKNVGTILPCSFVRVLYGMRKSLPVDYIPHGMDFITEEEFNENFEMLEKQYGSCAGLQSFDFLKVTMRMVFAKFM